MTRRLLAVDTASEICGVALVVDGVVISELVLNQGGTHTKTVMGAIKAVLDTAGVSVEQMDAFIVTRGPGSFTGLRIGVSTVKGLATAMAKPIVGICSLEVLAHQAFGQTPLVCALMDARRNEVYWGLFRRSEQGLVSITGPRVGPVTQIASHIDEPCMLIGNGVRVYRNEIEPLTGDHVQWSPDDSHGLRPSGLAHLGWDQYQQEGGEDADLFTPLYLRKSDAELNRKGH